LVHHDKDERGKLVPTLLHDVRQSLATADKLPPQSRATLRFVTSAEWGLVMAEVALGYSA
jgi:hypothetical protein